MRKSLLNCGAPTLVNTFGIDGVTGIGPGNSWKMGVIGNHQIPINLGDLSQSVAVIVKTKTERPFPSLLAFAVGPVTSWAPPSPVHESISHYCFSFVFRQFPGW